MILVWFLLVYGMIRLFTYKFPLVAKRAFPGDLFKTLMKAREIVKAAVITYLFQVQVCFDQELTGLSDFYFREELRIGFARP